MKETNARLNTDSEVVQLVSQLTIGQILVNMGKLNNRDARRVFEFHKNQNIRFGEAAIRLKLVTQTDVDHALSVQFDYPLLRTGQAGISEEVVVAFNTQARAAESIRELRSELMMRWLGAKRKMLAVVGAGDGPERSFIVANLGAAFAQLDERTLIIDADMRNPRQHEIFRLPAHAGLSTLLNGRGWTEIVQPISYFGTLSVLAGGPPPPNPTELLCRPSFQHLLDDVQQDYDVILIDTSASSLCSDARLIAARAGFALMVVRQDSDRLSDVERLKKGVIDYGGELIGAVMT